MTMELGSIEKIPVGNTFRKELEALINRYSKESESNTPDFVLAEFLLGCLRSFDLAVQAREVWYGRLSIRAEEVDGRMKVSAVPIPPTFPPAENLKEIPNPCPICRRKVESIEGGRTGVCDGCGTVFRKGEKPEEKKP